METIWLTMSPAWSMTLAIAAARTTGLLMTAPIFSHAAVPAKLRIFMALTIALAATSLIAPTAMAPPSGAAQLILALVSEALLGVALGYGAQLVFAGVQMGATHIGRQMGVDLGGAFNPSGGDSSSPVVRLLTMLAIVIFLAIGGLMVLRRRRRKA